jgi:putative membrane protein
MSFYLWLKVFHIVFMVSAFSGIFYLPRLFVYHIESDNASTRDYLSKMENRLFRFTLLLLSIGIILGVAMGSQGTNFIVWFSQSWLILKVFITFLVIGYLVVCKKIMRQLSNNTCGWTSRSMRLFNEIPVILLLIAVMAAVFKF